MLRVLLRQVDTRVWKERTTILVENLTVSNIAQADFLKDIYKISKDIGDISERQKIQNN